MAYPSLKPKPPNWAKRTAVACLYLLAVSAVGGSDDKSTRSGALARKEMAQVRTVDLHALGYTEPQTPYDKAGRWLDSGIAFTDDDTVATWFLAQETTTRTVLRKRSRTSYATRMHAVFLRASTGRVRAQQEWPTPSYPTPALLPTSSGRFLIRAGELMTLYSPDLKPIRELTLPRDPGSEWLGVQASVTGKQIFLYQISDRRKQRRLEILDADTLELLDSWTDEEIGSFAVGDNQVVQKKSSMSSPKEQILIRDLGKPWRSLYRSDENACLGRLAFVTKATILVPVCGGMALMSTEGSVLWREQFRDGEFHVRTRSSQGGDRLAVAAIVEKVGFDNPRVTRLRVAVYDVTTHAVVFNLELKPVPRQNFDFALSPTGSTLAVLADGLVKLFALP